VTSLSGLEWSVQRRGPRALFDALPDVPALAVQILHNRGVTTPEGILEFVEGPLPPHDPYLLDGMEAAVQRLARAARTRERICVYTDFDVDGVASAAVLVEAFARIGCRAFAYIPERVAEGYGLNAAAIDTVKADGATLLVTADCGASSAVEIAHAAASGLDVIVTDHHHADGTTTAALATLNPNRPGAGYPFAGLAGVGVAYKLVQALAEEFSERLPSPEDLLDLVALGTVADQAPMRDENRTLVAHGLEVLRQSPRPGLQALAGVTGRPLAEADVESIGYAYAPRLNAAGRLAHAHVALELLQSEHPIRAEELAQQLDTLNHERRQLTEDVVAHARAQVDAASGLAFAVGDDYAPGITGLAAARLAAETGLPAFVGTVRNGVVRGSARAPVGVHLAELLGRYANLLIQFGGHARAAGFTVARANVAPLRTALAAELSRPDLRARLGPKLLVDCRLYPATVSWETYQTIAALGPYGESHEPPRFAVENVAVDQARAVGQRHVALQFAELGAEVDAIWFGAGDARAQLTPGRRVDVAFRLGVRVFRGAERLQLLVDDICLVGPS